MFKKINLLNKILKLNALYKALAIFFILFTFLDILLFGYCGEELPFPNTCLSEIVEVNVTNSDDKIVLSTTIEQEHKKHTQAPCSTDEDCCFCCCAHWVLTGKIFINKTEITLPLEQPYTISLPESPSSKTYHPPRNI